MAKKTVVIIIVVIFALPFLYAQYQGKIEGMVVDEKGSPLEKVEVSIISQRSSGIHFDLLTDKEGKFIQIGLHPGQYMISFKKAGFAPASSEIRVGVAGAEKLMITLKSSESIDQKALSAGDRLFIKGNKLYADGKFDEAAAVYLEAIEKNSSNWGYYLNLGLALKKKNDAEGAMSAFRKAVELNPESFSANKELGEALAKSGDLASARAFYAKAAALNPDDPDIHYNLGLCLNSVGEPLEALESFKRAVELKPEYAEAHYEMGTILIGQNRVKEAIESLEIFLKLAPEHEKAPVARQLLEYLKK